MANEKPTTQTTGEDADRALLLAKYPQLVEMSDAQALAAIVNIVDDVKFQHRLELLKLESLRKSYRARLQWNMRREAQSKLPYDQWPVAAQKRANARANEVANKSVSDAAVRKLREEHLDVNGLPTASDVDEPGPHNNWGIPTSPFATE